MSCDHAIWYPHKRVSNAEAGEIYLALCDGDSAGLQAHPAIESTDKHGLAVYDPQSGQIHYPTGLSLPG